MRSYFRIGQIVYGRCELISRNCCLTEECTPLAKTIGRRVIKLRFQRTTVRRIHSRSSHFSTRETVEESCICSPRILSVRLEVSSETVNDSKENRNFSKSRQPPLKWNSFPIRSTPMPALSKSDAWNFLTGRRNNALSYRQTPMRLHANGPECPLSSSRGLRFRRYSLGTGSEIGATGFRAVWRSSPGSLLGRGLPTLQDS